MARNDRTVFLTGAAMLVAGIVLAVLSVGGGSGVLRFIPVVSGVAICAGGAATRVPGMYLPGALVTGAGIGLVIALGPGSGSDHASLIGVFLLCIGGALALVPFLSRLSGYTLVRWPFVPAVALLFCGVVLAGLGEGSEVRSIVERVWPAAVALSVAFLVIVFWKSR